MDHLETGLRTTVKCPAKSVVGPLPKISGHSIRGYERNFINLTQMFDHVQMHTNKLYLDTFPFPFSIFEFNCSTVLKIISYYCLDFKPLLSTPKKTSEILKFWVAPKFRFEIRFGVGFKIGNELEF